jgi:hypothetical protein
MRAGSGHVTAKKPWKLQDSSVQILRPLESRDQPVHITPALKSQAQLTHATCACSNLGARAWQTCHPLRLLGMTNNVAFIFVHISTTNSLLAVNVRATITLISPSPRARPSARAEKSDMADPLPSSTTFTPSYLQAFHRASPMSANKFDEGYSEDTRSQSESDMLMRTDSQPSEAEGSMELDPEFVLPDWVMQMRENERSGMVPAQQL